MKEIINNKKIAYNLTAVSRLAAITVLILGGTVSIGWLLDIPSLKSLHPEFVTMKFNTALLFFLSGGLVLLINDDLVFTEKWIISFFISSVIIVAAILTFIQYPLGLNLGIDELLIKDAPDAIHTYSPGRMALNTSFCFILTGFALMFILFKRYFAAQFIALFLFLFCFIQLLGYIYRIPEVYGFLIFTKMALHTIIGLIFLSIAILFLFPQRGYLATVIGDTAGGYIARRLVPTALLLPVVLIAMRLSIEQMGIFKKGEDIQVISAFLIVMFLGLVWRFLVSIDMLDKGQKEARASAKEWYNLMNYIIQHDPSAIAVHDNNLRYIFVSERYLNDHRVKEKDIIGKYHYDVFPEIPERWREVHRRALKGEVLRSNDDDLFIRNDGSVEHTRWECRPWYKMDESIGGIILYTEVITKRKNIEKELRNTANQLNMVLDNAGDGIFAVDSEGKAVLVNRAASEMLGYKESELLGRVMHSYHHHTRADGTPFPQNECPVYRAFAEGKPHRIDYDHFWRSDGTGFPVEYTCNPVREDDEIIGAVVSFRDITLRKKAENRIIRSLYEKENLLREIFHRTNNNMLLIQSMLLLQASGNPDMSLPEFVDIIRERIDSMALVHKKLYASRNLSRIDLGGYVAELTSGIIDKRPDDSERVNITLELDYVPVLFDTAVPAGLIVHELVINSIKHASPEKRKVEISISLKTENTGIIELVIADKGTGGKEKIDPENLSTVGLAIVFLMARDQLKGTIALDQTGGMKYTIRFRDDLYEERV